MKYHERTVSLEDLIDRLTQVSEELEDQGFSPSDVMVYFAQQPSWPFSYSISDEVVVHDENLEREFADNEDFDYEDEDLDFSADAPEIPVVYLAERQQVEYLKGTVKKALGW